MDNVLMISSEDCKYIFNQLEFFLNNGISLSYRYNQPIKDFDALTNLISSDFNNNIDQFINMQLIKNSNIDWDFNCAYENDDIKTTMGFPWRQNLSLMLKSYANNRITQQDMHRYFELLEQNLPDLKEILHKKYESYTGSTKWLDAAKTWVQNMQNTLNTVFRNIRVNDVYYTEGTARNMYFIATFTFSDELQYQQKKKLEIALNTKVLPRYNSTNSTCCRTLHQCQNIDYDFSDNSRKCNPAKSITFKLLSNKWNALGMSEEAQFIPKMGMHKKFQI